MKDTFNQDIINNMCSKYGYNLCELEKIQDIDTKWAIVNSSEDILVFLKDEEAVDIEISNKLYDIVRNISDGKSYRLIKVIIFEKNADNYMQQYIDMCRNYNIADNAIVFDKVKMHITISSESVRNVSQQIINSIVIKKENNIWSLKNSPVTYTLIAINVIIFLISAYMSGDILTIDSNVLVTLGAKVNQLIVDGQYYRVITCMFLHGGLLHIALNMYSHKYRYIN